MLGIVQGLGQLADILRPYSGRFPTCSMCRDFMRDPSEHNYGGWSQDVSLLNRLVPEKLKAKARPKAGSGSQWRSISLRPHQRHVAEQRNANRRANALARVSEPSRWKFVRRRWRKLLRSGTHSLNFARVRLRGEQTRHLSRKISAFRSFDPRAKIPRPTLQIRSPMIGQT